MSSVGALKAARFEDGKPAPARPPSCYHGQRLEALLRVRRTGPEAGETCSRSSLVAKKTCIARRYSLLDSVAAELLTAIVFY
jgi:hypothetical protein